MNEYCKLNLAATTNVSYRKKIDNHIRAALGMYKLKSITPAALQKFINDKFNDGYRRNTIIVFKGILSGALSYAVEPSAFIQDNPITKVKLPATRAKSTTPTRKKEKEIITLEQ